MLRNRLKFALEQLGPGDWEAFEAFASSFLTLDYPGLRSLSIAGLGDEGRDAVLYSPAGDPTVILQYSVTEDWASKIRKTARRLEKANHDAKFLVYATNRVIGAAGDSLRRELRRDFGLALDYCDAGYFLDRCAQTRATEEASEGLAQRFVDPLLPSRRLIGTHAHHLTSEEARSACVYLAMQREDDAQDKGLTRSAYEALVRAALRETTPESRMSRDEVHSAVLAAVPSQDPSAVGRFVDLALARLEKKYIRHYRKEDTFCLTYEERARMADRLAALAVHDDELRAEAERVVRERVRVHNVKRQVEFHALAGAAWALIDRYLFMRGEAFVQTVQTGELPEIDPESLRRVAANMTAERDSAWLNVPKTHVDPVIESARLLLESPSPHLQRHLRHFADAYIVFAFLRETPDVQAVLSKLFADGELWIDTNVIIRLFAERLLDSQARRYSHLLYAARQSGLRLRITEGVLEETEAHTFLSLRYARNDERQTPWRAGVPFLFTAFALTGRAKGEFAQWLETFRGAERPFDDLTDYVHSEHGIAVGSLAEDAARAPIEVSGAVREFWIEVHENRHKTPMREIDQARKDALVTHDLESYLGVLFRRQRRRDSTFGYSTWWLTLDRAAYEAGARTGLDKHWDGRFQSPTISPDFLSAYLAVGPVRDRVRRLESERLPLMLDLGQLEVTEPEFVNLGESLRQDLKGLPEHVIRRRVRDGFDRARTRMGPIARGGVARMLDELRADLVDEAKR